MKYDVLSSKAEEFISHEEILATVEYANENNVSIILLSGDVFDSDKPYKKDKLFFYSIIEKYPNIDFMYLRGNHDSYEFNNQDYPNLKTFSEFNITLCCFVKRQGVIFLY